MKRLTLFATALLIAVCSYAANTYEQSQTTNKDSYAYQEVVVGSDTYHLTNDWLYSATLNNLVGNLPDSIPHQTGFVRSFVQKDSIIYFPYRTSNEPTGQVHFVRVDATTGKRLSHLFLAENIFKVDDAFLFGAYNDLKLDDAGNAITSNMCLSGTAFQIWKIDLNTGTGEILIDMSETGKQLKDIFSESGTIRIDYIGVSGDVTKDAIIMACSAFNGCVYYWNIKNGTWDGTTYEIESVLEATTGSFPCIQPKVINNDTLFYLDRNDSYPTLYKITEEYKDDEDRIFKKYMIVSDFSTEAAKHLLINRNGQYRSRNNNGVTEFSINGRHYLLVAGSYSAETPANTFVLYQFKNSKRNFEEMTQLYEFPYDGMGNNANGLRLSISSVDVNEATGEIKIYVYNPTNGYGAYTLSTEFANAKYIYTKLGGDSVSIAVNNGYIYEENVVIPDTTIIDGQTYRVTAIADSAFIDCYDIVSITIPDNITSIGKYAFYNCSSLKSVTIGKSVTYMGYKAFENCSSLTKTQYMGNIADWCSIYFGNYLSNPVVYSGNLFINDVEVKDLVIPEGVTYIGRNAFNSCKNITSVSLPNTLTEIRIGAFNSCSNLQSIRIPNNVSTIEGNTFYGCSNLLSIRIGESVTSIGERAFQNCSKLTNIISLAHTPPSVGSNAFYNIPTSAGVTVPCGIAPSYRVATGWSKFTYIYEDLVYDFKASAQDETTGLVQTLQSPTCALPAIIKAIPMDGYKFLTWSDGNTLSMRQITIESDMNLSALFVPENGSGNVDSITVIPTDSTAVFTWPAVEGAASYTLIVWADENETERICTLTFDAAGRLTNLDFSKRKPTKQQAAGFGLNFTVTGLDKATTYGYTIESKTNDNVILSSQKGSFQTTGGEIAVIGILLDKSSIELFVGDTEQLKATISPENATNQSIIWNSSDKKVAIVEDGLITALTEGTATITATTEDGGKTATCEVNVKPDDTAVENINLNNITRVQKLLENGTIYILRNGEKYTVDGRLVE